MSWTFVGATSNQGSSVSSLAVDKHASAAEGDYAVAVVSYYSALTLTPPSGWTEQTPPMLQEVDGSQTKLFKKQLGASEPGSYSWSLSSPEEINIGIIFVRGHDPASPVDVMGASSINASSTSAPAGTVTPTTNGALLVYMMSAAKGGSDNVDTTTATPPSGYTERIDQNGNQYEYIYIATKVQTTAASETPTATLNAARKNRAVVLALRVLVPPNAPTLNSATPGNAQVALVWSAPGSGTTPSGYKVRRGTSPGTYTTTVDVGNVTSYTVTGLTNGTTYYFDIVAYNTAGDGGDSGELSATPSNVSPPSAPTLASLIPGSTQLIASWGSVAGATGYKVQIKAGAGAYGSLIDVGNVLTYTFTGLTNGTTYTVRMVAYNGGGNSSNSNELSATPSATSRIQTKYNDMAVGDLVFLEKLFTLEVLSVLQHSAADAGKVYKSVTDGYEFEVTRDVDGTGKNDWVAGDGYVNTGSPGTGFIDQYSYSSVLSRPFEFIAVDGTIIDSFSVDFTLLTGLNSVLALGMSNVKFDSAFITLKTPAVYAAATIVYEYWNGSAWTTLTATVAESDASNNAVATVDWKTAGNLSITFTPPAGWAKTTLAGQNAYWIRVRVSAATTWTQNPKQGGGKWITRGKRQYGPAIAMWRRMSTTWNDLREAAAIGNLQGFYDYGAPTMGAAFGDPGGVWVSIDAARGIRFMNVNSPIVSIDTSGAFLFRGPASASVNVGALRWNPSTYVFEGGYYAPAAGPAYGAFTQQWATDAANGEIVAAAGVMRIGAQGLRITADYSYNNTRAVRWVSGANDLAKIWVLQQSSTRGDLYLETGGSGEVVLANSTLFRLIPSLALLSLAVDVSTSGDIGANDISASGIISGASISVTGAASAASVAATGAVSGNTLSAPAGASGTVNMVGQRLSSADDYGAVISPIERAGTLRQWTLNLYVATTSNGSNYWTITLKRLDTNATIDTFNTSAIPANTWTRVARTLSTSLTTGMAGLYVDITKTGSPGNLQSAQSLYLQ